MRRDPKDKGAILLTTLLVMSLMSALAVAMMNDIRMAILRSGNIQAHAQAEWYVKAAEDFASAYVEASFLTLPVEQKNTALLKPIESTLPVDGGIMRLTVMDGTQCLPLGAVTMSSESEGDGESSQGLDAVFRRLLVSAGLSGLDAVSLTAAVADWQDLDLNLSPGGAEDYTYLGLNPAYRTSNAPMLSIGELRAVRGMNEDILKALTPYICTGDASRAGKININTMGPMHLPLIGAMLGDNEETLAARILQARPAGGFKDLVPELTAAGFDAAKVDASRFVLEPESLWIEVDVELGQASRTVLLEFKIDTDGLTRTYRHYGTEGRRPWLTLEDLDEEEDGS